VAVLKLCTKTHSVVLSSIKSHTNSLRRSTVVLVSICWNITCFQAIANTIRDEQAENCSNIFQYTSPPLLCHSSLTETDS